MLDKIKEFGLKCIHRHTIEEHPNCFAEEKINIKQAEKIATVLGMLELTKIKIATISQRKPFGKIVLKRRESLVIN